MQSNVRLCFLQMVNPDIFEELDWIEHELLSWTISAKHVNIMIMDRSSYYLNTRT